MLQSTDPSSKAGAQSLQPGWGKAPWDYSCSPNPTRSQCIYSMEIMKEKSSEFLLSKKPFFYHSLFHQDLFPKNFGSELSSPTREYSIEHFAEKYRFDGSSSSFSSTGREKRI